MPLRIQPNRPYYPRIYAPRVPPGRAPAAGRGRGALGGAIDTSSTGNIGGDIVKAIGNQIQQNAANRFLNTQTPPRAAWVGGTAPAPSVSLGGTAPQTGGVGELQMRQQEQQQDLADQLTRAKIAAELALVQQRSGRGGGGGGAAGGGNAARWQQYLGSDGQGGQGGTARAGKPAPYQPFQYDANTDPRADAFPHVQTDFDSQFGKGMYAKVMPNLANTIPDDKGNYVINDSKGNPATTLSPSDANYWLSRYNAARVAAGQQPILSNKFPSANANSGQPAGTQVNPYKPTNQLEARSLPFNSYFVDPNSGQVGQKLPETQSGQGQQNQPAQQNPPPQQTSMLDQGDQGDQLPMSAPVPPDLTTGVGTDTTGAVVPDTGSQDLADAIQRAKAQNQLMAA